MANLSRAMKHKRQALVGQLWLRGDSERQIAVMVRKEAANPASELRGCEKTHYVTVHGDVVANRERWLKQMNDPTDHKRSDQVARLLDIQHQAWADFSRMAITSPQSRARYLGIALEAEEKLAKILGTLAPTRLTGGEGEPLMPPNVLFHFSSEDVIKAPRNGEGKEEAEAILSDHGDNGH